MKNFYRKVAFGLKPEEKAPSDPLTCSKTSGDNSRIKLEGKTYLLRKRNEKILDNPKS